MSYIDDLNQAAAEALAASASATDSSQIIYDVANGDENTTVTTANGEVKSLAKAIADITAELKSGVFSTTTEVVTLEAGQTLVTLTETTTNGMQLYVEGVREFDFTITSESSFTLSEALPGGTRIWVVGIEFGEDASTSSVVNPSTGVTRTLGDWVAGIDYTYITLEDALLDDKISLGTKVKTLGYSSLFDGGGNEYTVIAGGSGDDDGGRYITHVLTGLQLYGGFPSGLKLAQYGGDIGAALNELRRSGAFDALDLDGRIFEFDSPVDVASYYGQWSSLKHCTIKNGTIRAADGFPVSDVFTDSISFTAGSTTAVVSDPTLFDKGMHVDNPNVPKETYVVSVDVDNSTITLSMAPWRTVANATCNVRDYKYVLDFKNVPTLLNMKFEGIMFDMRSNASIFRCANGGGALTFTNCVFHQPKDRGLTFWNGGSSNLEVDTCEGRASTEDSVLSPSARTSILLNANGSDVKLRGNLVWQFRHVAVLHSKGGVVMTGNHFWQGTDADDGTRTACVIFTAADGKHNITGNYIDNSWIEISNSSTAGSAPNFAIGGMTITGNQFTANMIGNYTFSWIVVRSFTQAALLRRLVVSSNIFKQVNPSGLTERIERFSADTGVTGVTGSLDRDLDQVIFANNVARQVDYLATSTCSQMVEVEQGSEVDFINLSYRYGTLQNETYFPFGGNIQDVTSVAFRNQRDATGALSYYPANVRAGLEDGMAHSQFVRVNTSAPVSGKVTVVASSNPACITE